ncbi:MAG: PAS domain-containing protein [Kiritimatiellaeota bacterium]|nr:PAS domain-containing protein [Kiritimatiellota bacterium]
MRQLIWRVVLPYAGFGAPWTVFSDMLVTALLHDPLAVERASIFKGWAFVLATSALLLWLLRRELHRRHILETTQRVSQTLIDHLPQRIFFKDTQSVYVSCNEVFAADMQQQPDAIAGKSDFDFYPRDLAEKYRADDQRVLASGQTCEVDERYVVGERERWIHTVKTPIRDAAGQPLGILGMFWDITERRQAAVRLEKLNGPVASASGFQGNRPAGRPYLP